MILIHVIIWHDLVIYWYYPFRKNSENIGLPITLYSKWIDLRWHDWLEALCVIRLKLILYSFSDEWCHLKSIHLLLMLSTQIFISIFLVSSSANHADVTIICSGRQEYTNTTFHQLEVLPKSITDPKKPLMCY